MSATQTADWALEELLENHQGQLIGPDRVPIVLDTDDPDEVEKFDNAFREDTRRFINAIKAKGHADWTGKYRLQKRMIYPMSLLWFALEIHRCRTTGHCLRSIE